MASDFELIQQGPDALIALKREDPKRAFDLAGRDLRGENLGGYDLSGSNLEEAQLDGVNLNGANLSGANLAGASLHSAILCRSDLSEANLQHSDLREAQFNDGAGGVADLTDADLRGARVTSQGEGDVWNGFLELATVKGLDSVKFSNANFLPDYLFKVVAYLADNEPPESLRYPALTADALKHVQALRNIFVHKSELPPRVLTLQDYFAATVLELIEKPELIHTLPPRRFEELVAEILSRFGFSVQLLAATRDGGYDIFAVQDNALGMPSTWLVECKRYSPGKLVGLDVLRSLYAVKTDMGASNVLLATTSRFTAGVEQYAAARYDVSLRDYYGVQEWLRQLHAGFPQAEQAVAREGGSSDIASHLSLPLVQKPQGFKGG